jgi:hypothetical protein
MKWETYAGLSLTYQPGIALFFLYPLFVPSVPLWFKRGTEEW